MRKFYDTELVGPSKGGLPKPFFAKLIGEWNGVVYANHKLFLCNRDITPMLQEMWDSPDSKSSKEPYKVIGEISPNSKWVKEGDEFDEGEVKFMEFIAMMGSDEVSYERFKEFKGDHNYISLKGPCGHFH